MISILFRVFLSSYQFLFDKSNTFSWFDKYFSTVIDGFVFSSTITEFLTRPFFEFFFNGFK